MHLRHTWGSTLGDLARSQDREDRIASILAKRAEAEARRDDAQAEIAGHDHSLWLAGATQAIADQHTDGADQ